jgi:small subunit ribosomal protein S17
MSEETVKAEGGEELPLVTSGAAARTEPRPTEPRPTEPRPTEPRPTAAVEGAGSSDEHTSTSESPLAGAPAAQPQQSETPKRHLRKTRVGEVVSNKMNKTIVVAVVRRVPHTKFGKIVKRTKKFYVHDEHNQCAIGDLVRVEETRPLSRLKRWQLVEVLKH